MDLLRPFDADKMIAWKVDRKVGNVKNDTSDLVEEIADGQPETPETGSLGVYSRNEALNRLKGHSKQSTIVAVSLTSQGAFAHIAASNSVSRLVSA